MKDNNKTAVILGATGLIGSYIVHSLVQDDRYSKVTLIVRQPLSEYIDHPKIKQIVLQDFKEITPEMVEGHDHAFSALGSTIKKAGSEENFQMIDYGLNLHFAQLFVGSNTHYLLVSSLGTDPNSKSFYLRIKGELEASIKALNLYKTSFFRPSLLLGKRHEKRMLEKLLQMLFKIFSMTIPKKYRAVKALQVATCMIKAANTQAQPLHVYGNKEILTCHE